MILLSSIINTFKTAFFNQYAEQLLPSHYRAMSAMERCRNDRSPLMKISCEACDHKDYLPHSCGHRNCPHCQHYESQRWLDRQLKKQVSAEYFMITFTLPAEFRPLAWSHQRIIYHAVIQSAWETLKSFSARDKQLQGIPGAIAVLYTHARNLDFHPHVHLIMPAAAIEAKRLWRTKTHQGKTAYLFNHKALAKVFRAKVLNQLSENNLTLPDQYPEKWVVDCKPVGKGEKALIYLGRYLYRGVIAEKDILACEHGNVTYRYKESKTGTWQTKTVAGAEFLWRLMRHVLPKGFRRARNFGFLHPNSKRLIHVLQLRFNIDPNPFTTPRERPVMRCPCCGEKMVITGVMISHTLARRWPTRSILGEAIG